ncbi:MAG: hypothetical protein P8M17_12590 [Saprospiraceae bacterium]|mgnify:FL=1|nr:hypothetical protein [bacterium]MDG2419826.1 hypothetical protein [Saprospiraceae bacterium]
MEKERNYEKLENIISPYKAVLGKAVDTVLVQEISKYPIFVLHKEPLELGISLKNEINTPNEWLVNLSTLEEFSTKQVIEASRVNRFTKIYKNPSEFLCLFVLDEFGANFVFLPRA